MMKQGREKKIDYLSNSLNLPSTIAGTFCKGFISENTSNGKKN
jgi:hypothetical protein